MHENTGAPGVVKGLAQVTQWEVAEPTWSPRPFSQQEFQFCKGGTIQQLSRGFFFLYNSASGLWEASDLGLPPSGAAFYFIYFLARVFAPWFLGMGLMPRSESCTVVLTVSESLVSHDMACPQVSLSLPNVPALAFFLC